MEFLWEHSPATGDDVRATIGKDRPLTDSTIRTVLRRLEAKGYAKHVTEGQFLYSSVREPKNLAVDYLKHVLKKFCRGSLEELLTRLVDNRVVDGVELKRLAARIEAQQKNGGK